MTADTLARVAEIEARAKAVGEEVKRGTFRTCYYTLPDGDWLCAQHRELAAEVEVLRGRLCVRDMKAEAFQAAEAEAIKLVTELKISNALLIVALRILDL